MRALDHLRHVPPLLFAQVHEPPWGNELAEGFALRRGRLPGRGFVRMRMRVRRWRAGDRLGGGRRGEREVVLQIVAHRPHVLLKLVVSPGLDLRSLDLVLQGIDVVHAQSRNNVVSVDDASEMRLQISRQRFVAARRNPEPYRLNVSGGVGGVVEDDRSKDGDSAGAERVADESDLVGVRQTMENLTQPELRVHVLCPAEHPTMHLAVEPR
mmetsp:Transcript_48635/g.115450  ORF Transcript_48635/g.115450 Transcript_48635/m.115450 type:complete len:211 (+) Transcript_48635:383-1015(+)